MTSIVVSERNGWWIVQRCADNSVATIARERVRFRAVEYARTIVRADPSLSLFVDGQRVTD